MVTRRQDAELEADRQEHTDHRPRWIRVSICPIPPQAVIVITSSEELGIKMNRELMPKHRALV